jgi:hypothetical protein|tara:strand:+ start:167 stop:364 length:198 start_codon:yes stop_codon:yes gene_type:complete
MKKKLAKLKYLPNHFKVLENGEYVLCAVSGKEIDLNKLTYWNVDLQEPYFSYKEAFERNEQINKK